MTMAKIAGRLQTLSTDGVAIGGVVDASLNGENETIDTTTHDDASKTFIYNRFTGTIDGSLLWDDVDAGQEQIKADFFGQTTSVYLFRLQVGTGFDEFSATGLVTSFAPTGPNDDAAEFSFTIQLTGAMTRSAQA